LPQRVPLIQFCERLVLHRRCDESDKSADSMATD
jgi:hypothetical protein